MNRFYSHAGSPALQHGDEGESLNTSAEPTPLGAKPPDASHFSAGRLYVTGVSGTGKSSLVEELRKRGIQAFDLDTTELCYWKNKTSGEEARYQYGIGKDWLEAHDYICNAIELKKLLDAQNDTPVVIAGFASNQDEYLDLFDKILLLYCREETFLHRLNTRTENEFAKEKSEQEYMLSWYKEFEKKMRGRGATPINTEDALSCVVDQIVFCIHSS